MSMLERLRENVQFRMNSLKAMVMGDSNAQEAQPVERRREIMRRRREALDELRNGEGEEGADVSSSGPIRSRVITSSSSRSISGDTSPNDSSGGDGSNGDDGGLSTSPARVSSMGEVQRGTVERATERGYGQ